MIANLSTGDRASRVEVWATVVMAVVALAVGLKILIRPSVGATADSPPVTVKPAKAVGEVAPFVLPSLEPTAEGRRSVRLIEFMDVECPFCARYASTIDSAVAILGDSISVHVAHMPLRNHKLARPGAIAVECAFRLGVGREYVSTVYRQQDSLGVRSWAQFAADAGLRDTLPFEACRRDPAIQARIDSATSARTRAEIPGTPTVWIDSWQYSSPPDLDRLLGDIRILAAGGVLKQ